MIGSALNFTKHVAGALLLSASIAASAQALPQFTFNPGAVGLDGGTSFTADNIILSDYATATFTPNGIGGANFTESGVLAVGAFQNGASFVLPTGLNSTYGLYFGFDAAGTINTPTFQASSTGAFSSVNYTLFGYDILGGPGSITYQPTNTTPGGAANVIPLATGTLIDGGVAANEIGGVPVPNAQLFATFQPTAAGQAFFVSPSPFYQAVFAAFTNTPTQIQITANGFIIDQGGGAANFLANPTQTPEPASMALLGAGLLGLGFLRRRTAA